MVDRSDPAPILHNSHWGPFLAYRRPGQVTDVKPALDDADPAQMLRSIPGAVHAKSRVRRPAVREGWLRSDRRHASGRGRGREPFVEVPWDTALDLLTEELTRVRTDHGHASIFGGSYGWASAGRFHHAKTQLNRFLALTGGYTGQISNYSYAVASTVLPHIVGSAEAATGGVTSWPVLAAHTDLWVMFGGAAQRTAQVESGGMRGHTAMGWLRELRRRRTDFVLVSPLRDDLPSDLEAEWLAIRPGTDTALLLALTYELMASGRHDEEFLSTYCVGWPHVRDYLTGKLDGVRKDARWAAGVCDLDGTVIAGLARRMADRRTLVSATWSLQRAEHGEQPYWAVITLAAALGQIGLPGGGFGFGYGDTGLVGQPRLPFSSPGLRAGRNPGDSAIPVARITDMLNRPGERYQFNGTERTYPDIRLVYWAGGNPFHHHQDLNTLASAWQRPETIVVHEPWWTATARRADIVLPATTTLERNDIASSSKDSAISAMYQVIEPIGEALSDYEIFVRLGERLGVGELISEGRDEMQWLEHLYEKSRQDAARAGYRLASFEEFWHAGVVDIPDLPDQNLLGQYREDPLGERLATPSGKIELFSSTVASFGYADCPGHAVWLPPSEYLGSELAERFPLHLISNQPATRLHSQLDMAGASADSKVQGREPCRMHPDDAASRGLTAGQVVRVFNDRGECLAGLTTSPDVRPGVVQLSTGAWFEPLDACAPSALEIHGNPNVLTFDRGSSQLSQGTSAHTTLVEVTPYDGALPPLTVHDQPDFTP